MTSPIPTLKQTVNNILYIMQRAFKPDDGSTGTTSPQTPTAAALRRDNDRIQAFALGSAITGLYKYVSTYIANQSNPLTATGVFLTLWGKLYNIFLKLANASQGPVLITGTDGTPVPANTLILRPSDGWQFKTNADVTISGGTVTVYVTAVKGGVAGNTPNGTVLSLSTSIPGVASIAVTTDDTYTAGLQGGTDDETPDDFRNRIIFRVQNPPHGGAPSDYEMWATELPGVTQAWCTRVPSGPGTVGLRWMMNADNGFDGFPQTADQTALAAYLADPTRGPAADDVELPLLTANPVDITITGMTPNDAATRAAVKAELQDLFYRDRKPAGTTLVSHIDDAIADAMTSEDYDYSLDSPTTATTATADQINTLGVLTINGVAV